MPVLNIISGVRWHICWGQFHWKHSVYQIWNVSKKTWDCDSLSFYLLPVSAKRSYDGRPFWIIPSAWWRHQMETFSALLVICAGNSPVTGEFPAQRPALLSFDVFFDLRLNKRLSKQSCGWWFETPSRHHDVFVMHQKYFTQDPLWKKTNKEGNVPNVYAVMSVLAIIRVREAQWKRNCYWFVGILFVGCTESFQND